MGKIKGWRKVKDQKEWVIYENEPSSVEIWLLTGRKHGSKVEYFDRWFVWRNAIVGAGTMAGPMTKDRARNFAVNYMRGHPNG